VFLVVAAAFDEVPVNADVTAGVVCARQLALCQARNRVNCLVASAPLRQIVPGCAEINSRIAGVKSHGLIQESAIIRLILAAVVVDVKQSGVECWVRGGDFTMPCQYSLSLGEILVEGRPTVLGDRVGRAAAAHAPTAIGEHLSFQDVRRRFLGTGLLPGLEEWCGGIGATRFPRAVGLLTGADIANLGDTALAHQVGKTDLFARVSPDQKTRIIRALRAGGHTVGFVGDGINDAPALHAADVGLAVESATEVARAAADMIMLESDLHVVHDAVEEGRRTYANIMKYLRMGTSSNFGNMLSMAVASVFIPFLPLTPIQVLLNNLIYDLSEIGIPYDTVERSTIRRPHGLEMSELLRFTLIMGPLSSVFDIAAFMILLHGFHASPEVFHTAWFVESMATQILVIFFIRSSEPFWKGKPHRLLVATSLGGLALAIAFALTPLGNPLGFLPLAPSILLAMGLLVIGYLAAAELVKRTAMAHRRRHFGVHPQRHH